MVFSIPVTNGLLSAVHSLDAASDAGDHRVACLHSVARLKRCVASDCLSTRIFMANQLRPGTAEGPGRPRDPAVGLTAPRRLRAVMRWAEQPHRRKVCRPTGSENSCSSSTSRSMLDRFVVAEAHSLAR